MLTTRLRVRLGAESLGAAGLLAAVVGSGVMAQRLTDDVALQLLVNAAATATVLGVLVSSLAPLSGAHLNPAVTLAEAVRGRHAWRQVAPYVVAQVVGAVVGTALANLMFGLPALHLSHHERAGAGLWLGEVVATAGLVLTIGLLRDGGRAALVVPAWIFGAYFLTSSTSFANPAVTVARAFSDTFAGIAPASVPAFVVAQLVGAAAAIGLLRILEVPIPESTATRESAA
ncbi:aquaporin [Phycicoccus sp. Soil803]|uniref:aquaporin n=1 Tax=Phycicoccus sp. Soil803 TaxID=1736415 RepID=UPI000ABBC6D8|nr:aquaporin [Phycicoccus sp. Soil803]